MHIYDSGTSELDRFWNDPESRSTSRFESPSFRDPVFSVVVSSIMRSHKVYSEIDDAKDICVGSLQVSLWKPSSWWQICSHDESYLSTAILAENPCGLLLRLQLQRALDGGADGDALISSTYRFCVPAHAMALSEFCSPQRSVQ